MPVSYPVAATVAGDRGQRNRLTVAARPILAIPHAILVGPIYWFPRSGSVGLLGAAAYVLAIVNWFALVFTGRELHGIRDFTLYYLRWRVRALAYMALFVDPYPPFGDASYPTGVDVIEPLIPRDRVSIGIRLILALPHLIVLCLLGFAWVLVTIVAWFAILFTRSYPASMMPFATGVMRWLVRVEAYLLLLVDEYPPFALD
jgi:hypothetical protein